VPQAGLDYVRKLRDMEVLRNHLRASAKQFEIAKIDEAAARFGRAVGGQAIPPDKKSFPNRVLIVVCSTIAGLVLAMFWVLFPKLFALRAKIRSTVSS